MGGDVARLHAGSYCTDTLFLIKGASSPNQVDRAAGIVGADATRATFEGPISYHALPVDFDELADDTG